MADRPRRVARVDGRAATDKASALGAIASALAFPPWFGRNLDALYDCLVDLSWLPAGEQQVEWSHADRLAAADPQTYRAVLGVLREAAAATAGTDRPLSVVLTPE